MLEDTVHIDGRLNLPALLADEFLHPLATGIVKVVGMNRRLRSADLGAIDTHPVAVVPFEVPGGGLAEQVPIGIVNVIEIGLPDSHGRQAVASGTRARSRTNPAPFAW